MKRPKLHSSLRGTSCPRPRARGRAGRRPSCSLTAAGPRAVLAPCEVLGEAGYAARARGAGRGALDDVFLCRQRFTASSGRGCLPPLAKSAAGRCMYQAVVMRDIALAASQ
jgi:hypothetical protein